MTAEALLEGLVGVRPRGTNRWSAHCPAHPDKSPSLSVRVAGTKILLKCWAGCEPPQIVAALGRTMADLFTDSPVRSRLRGGSSYQKIDLDDAGFRCELAALDRRLRAEQVLNAIAAFSGDALNDNECDRLMNAIALAYEDRDRATFLETIADDLRVKAFEERTRDHAA